MRLIRFGALVLVLLTARVSHAQEWAEYSNRADFFEVAFPGEPKVEEFTYLSEVQAGFPARRYTAEKGQGRYSVTVVDYLNAEKIHAERAKSCPPDVHSGCGGSPTLGLGGWIVDVHGAMDYAAAKYIVSDSKVTFYGWNFIDCVEGRQVQLTNRNGSRTFVGIYMHENRLYIIEGTVPMGAPEPGLLQQSMQFLDKDGKAIHYESIYLNGVPPPPHR